jgi:hypothetical protein
VRLVLGNERVFPERFYEAVLRGFEDAVVALGRRGKELDDQGGIEEGITLVVCILGLAANDNDIGISIKAAGLGRGRAGRWLSLCMGGRTV